MNTHSALDIAIDQLNINLQTLSNTMSEIRTEIANESKEQHNERIANEELRLFSEEPEHTSKLKQWGIHECNTDEEVKRIIWTVIDYRRDRSLHHEEREREIPYCLG